MSTTLPSDVLSSAPPPSEHAAPRLTRFAAISVSAIVLILASALAVFAHPNNASERGPADDTLGRFGFVALIAAVLAAVWLLDLIAHRPVLPAAEIFIPSSFIVSLFGISATTWLVYDHLVLDAFSRGKFGYLEWLVQVTNLVASRGIWNVWTPYPIGTQGIIVALRSITSRLASVGDSDVWTGYTLFRLAFDVVFLVAPTIVTVWLLAKTARSFDRASQTIATITLALSFGVLYFGAASTFVADPLPVCLTLASLFAIFRQRFVLAGIAIGCGAALKLFPILLLPAVCVVLPWRASLRVACAAVAVVQLMFIPGLLANSEMFWSPFNWQSSRPPWESLYAFVNWISGAPHDYPQPYFQDASMGSTYSWVFTGITPLVSALQSPVPPGPLRWENVTSLVGSLAVVIACLFARRRSPRALVRWSLFGLSGFFLFGIGWSPQYELFLIPFILLCFDNPFVGAGAALLLQAATFLDYPLLLPWAAFYGGSAVWLDWGAVIGRYVLLAWLCLYVLGMESSWSSFVSRVCRVLVLLRFGRRAAPVAASVLCFPILVGAAPIAQDSGGCAPSRSPTAADPGASPPVTDWSVPGGWFFTQAGEGPNRGFTIADDANAQMWSEFNRLGGWRALGFPASRRFVWHGALSQATQRAVLQRSPVTGQVEFANVLDLMHDDGRDADLERLKIPPPLDVDEAGLPYEAIAARRLAWLESRPAIKSKYCNAPGGVDPVELWGLPTSQAVNESEGGGDVYVLRTQRAAFQEWVAGAPWAAPGEVTVVLAGDLAKQFKLLPSDAVVPEPAPPRG